MQTLGAKRIPSVYKFTHIHDLYTDIHNLHIHVISLQCSHKVISSWLLFTANEVKVTDLVFLYFLAQFHCHRFYPDPWLLFQKCCLSPEGTMLEMWAVPCQPSTSTGQGSHHFPDKWHVGTREWGRDGGVFIFAFSVCQVLFIGMPLKVFFFFF